MERRRVSKGEDPEEAYKRFLKAVSIVAVEKNIEPIVLARLLLGITGQFLMGEAMGGNLSPDNPQLNYLRTAFLQQRCDFQESEILKLDQSNTDLRQAVAPIVKGRLRGSEKGARARRRQGDETTEEIHRIADELLKSKSKKDIAGIIIGRLGKTKSTVYAALKTHTSGLWKK